MFSALEPSFIMRSCNCCIDYYLKNKCFTCYSISFIIKLLCFSFIVKPSSYTLLLHLNCFNQSTSLFVIFVHYFIIFMRIVSCCYSYLALTYIHIVLFHFFYWNICCLLLLSSSSLSSSLLSPLSLCLSSDTHYYYYYYDYHNQ